MKVIMLSVDHSILRPDSEVRARMRTYATLCSELHIIVANVRSGGQEHHEGNLHMYPTNSSHKIWRIIDIYRRAKKCMLERGLRGDEILITTQDPFEMGFIGLMLKNKFHTKLQLQVHVDFLNKFFFREKFINMVRGVLALQILPRADGIRVVSERIKKSILERTHGKISANKIIVLPIYVDVAAIQETESIDLHKRFPQFKKIILMASRITNEKQIPWACSVIAEIVKQKHSDLGVVVVGDGPQRAEVEKYPFVRVIGWVEDVVPYMKGADLFLNTSLYEGYGRTLVQAAAAGVPTITTDVGVAREIFVNKKTALLIPVKNAEKLSEAVLGLFKGYFKLKKPTLVPQSREDYLKEYKKTWEAC